jgi:putative addiction module component (TIGR02574 family)
MSTLLDDLERQARALTPREKASLARILIEELDPALDAEVEQLWIAEAQRRYEAFLRGELEALPGDEVMARARIRSQRQRREM